MSENHGEDQPLVAKGLRVDTPGLTKKQIRKLKQAEEEAWASRSGPVMIRKKE